MPQSALQEIDPKTAHAWIKDGRAILVDIREMDEYAREHVPGSRLVPLSGFDPNDFEQEHDKIGVFHCGSGSRTREAAARILGTGFKEVYHLQGGFQSWKQAGLPINVNRKAPISIMRQVQITAGSLVVLGVVLAVLVSPWFMALSAFVGAGLVFAGVSGLCGMANLLAFMPWNRPLKTGTIGAPTGAAT